MSNKDKKKLKKWVDKNGYKKAAKKLKAAGLINFDLRKKLSPQQKGAITRLSKNTDYRAASEYFYAMQQEKVGKKLSSKGLNQSQKTLVWREVQKRSDVPKLYAYEKIKVNKKQAKILRKKGMHVHNGFIYYPKNPFANVTLEKAFNEEGTEQLAFIEKRGKNTETHFAFDERHILEQLDFLKDKKLPIEKNVFLKVGIGRSKEYTSHKALNNYAQEKFAREIEKYPELALIMGIEYTQLY